MSTTLEAPWTADDVLAKIRGQVDDETLIEVLQRAGIEIRFDIWDRLRKAREEAGLTQKQLAETIDVSLKTVVNYESPTYPSRKVLVLKQWAMATGFPYEWLAADEPSGGPDGAVDVRVPRSC